MANSKHFDKIAIIAVIIAVAFTIWFIGWGDTVLTPMSEVESEYQSDETVEATVTTKKSTTITVDGDDGEVSGSGASVSFGNITISDGGVYVISGTLSDGQIVVNAGGSDIVYLVLDGADISCSDDSAILVQSAGAVYLWTADGSENSIYTGADMEDSVDATAAGRNACLYTREDLILGGRGTLSITSDYQHGLLQDDDDDIVRIISGTYTITAVGKGIKTDGTLDVEGGDVTVDSTDDAIHADADVTLTGGSLTLSTEDDGIHSDTAIYLNGTDVEVLTAYEGIEALIIEMNGGDVKLTTTDDGLNGNGTGTEDTLVTINDGNLTILNPTGMDADGIDSNGSIVINGGYIYVSLTGDGTNSALDYGSENGGICTINGGTVIAAGGSGMLESVSDESAQGSITMVYETTYEAGTLVTVTDADGNELISQTIDDTMSAVTLSAAGIESGSTYTVTTGDDSEEITLDSVAYVNGEISGMGMGGGMGGGRMQGDAQDGQMPDMSEMPDGQMPDMSEMQGDSDGSTDSTNQSFGQRGGRGRMNMQNQGFTDDTSQESSDDTSSEANDQSGEMPDMSNMQDGKMPQMDGGQMGGQMPGGEEWDMDNQETQTASYTPTTTDWIYIGIGAAVLIVAIIFARIFKRRKKK